MNKKLDQGGERRLREETWRRIQTYVPAQRGLHPSSVPRRAFGKPPLPSDWYLGSPGCPQREEGRPSRWSCYWQPGSSSCPVGTPLPLSVSNEIFPDCGIRFLALGSWHPLFQKDTLKLEDIQR